MADLETGEPRPTRERLLDLIETVGGPADARTLVERNGAMRQRDIAESDGVPAVAGYLAGRFGA
jgi:hypothetical protein